MWVRKCGRIFRSYRILCPKGTIGLSLGFQPQDTLTSRAGALFIGTRGENPGLSPVVPSSFVILNYGGQVGTKIDLNTCPQNRSHSRFRARGRFESPPRQADEQSSPER
jgi:hypothetical protein